MHSSSEYIEDLKEKVSCEIRESPSMMWKGPIVQAKAGCARATTALALSLFVFVCWWEVGLCADLVIEIPGSGLGGAEGSYRLDYQPPHGFPAPNYTVPARASTINFQGLPGTKYHFMLYYNATFADLLTWNQTIITAPEPPTNLTVTLGRNKQATIAWSPPAHGDYTGFRFKVIPLTERVEGGPRNITVEGAGNWTYTLRDLSPGATYQLHAFTLLHDKESAAYASRNFTTRPNTPGKFIVWFRNETTLLVLWQPPYPPGAYTHYKVSIVPPDARDSEQYVEKEGEPPGPAQAAFKGLVPGRAYNISVQTVSEPEISAPTTAQYRTVPLRPRNVSVPAAHRTETAFLVTWLPPLEESEFEKYQVSVSASAGGGGGGGGGGAGAGAARRLAPVVRARDAAPACSFDGLEPGGHYTVTVKTMSGKVTSWPASADFTLKPRPVRELSWARADGEAVLLRWAPPAHGAHDQYKVWYHEAGPSRDDSNTLTTSAENVTLTSLLPGRNYTVAVSSVSRGVESNESAVAVTTRPLAPVLQAAAPGDAALAISWRSDVNSRQDGYVLRYRRRPPADDAAAAAAAADDDYRELQTPDTNATLTGLLPGAVYEVRLAALSHGLRSDWLTLLKPVRPLRARSLVVERATSNSLLARWEGPAAGGVLGAYVLQYRTTDEPQEWRTLPPLGANESSAELRQLAPGERYQVRLDTASQRADGDSVTSGHPLDVYHVVRPSPVSNVAPLTDTRNMTLEWPRPAGRVEHYRLRWWREGAEAEAGAGGQRDVPAAGGRTARALLAGLAPGAAYTISITAHSHGLLSDPLTMHARTRPLIQSEMTIVTTPFGDDEAGDDVPVSLNVTFTATPKSATLFDSYRFRLEGEGEGEGPARWATLPADAARRQLVFGGLVPGRLYNLTMWTVAANVTSHPVQRQARLYPLSTPWLNASAVGARDAALQWGVPRGDVTDYELQYLADGELHTRVTPLARLNVSALRPHTAYTFTVVVRAGTGGTLLTRSRARSADVRTREAPPAAPAAFRVVDAAPAALTLAWDMPAERRHGELRRFVLAWAPADRPERAASLELGAAARGGVARPLRPGVLYALSVRAETGAGAGPAAELRRRAPIAAPPPPAPAHTPRALRRSPATVTVRFRADFFSPANGNVTAYTLVLAEEPAAPAPARLPSWRDVHRLPVWPPYQVTEPYYPFQSSAVEEFTIGSERCDGGGRSYCNGPLKPGTTYYVKLRAFTAPDKYTDTEYAVIQTDVDNTAWIVGACVVAALGAGGGAALLLLRRLRRAGPAAAPAPAPRTSRPVRLDHFVDHYRLMSADSDFRFSEEFEELKHVGRDQPCTAADLPVNRPKNRFTNILPYDHSRYKLQPVDDEEGSDYINANYVPGHNSPREFIVTQGPLHCTRDDFWRMCWESGSRAIVMLTRCVEKGREKCDRYWPYDTRPVYYGDIAVTALNESRYPDWTITELMVCRGAEQRVLKHFHFTTWPDFGVPNPPTTLARFVRAFRERCPPDARPVIVHCSAGVGRSGTFITLDRALQQLAAHAEYIDIFGMVHGMRRERVWMVQTEQQYICIHQCLVAVLEGQDLQPPANHNHHHNPAFEDDEGIAESGM